MKAVCIFIILFMSFLLVRCNYIQDTKMYFDDIQSKRLEEDDNDYLIKRNIFLSDILKKENFIITTDFNKDRIIYYGKIYFVEAPKYLPQFIRQKYRNLADDFYKTVLSNKKYISYMKNVSFYAHEMEDDFILKIDKMEKNDILFTSLNDGYAVFLFDSIKFLDNYANKEKLKLLKFNYKEKKYMNALYYNKDVVRNYSFLFDITNENQNQDKVIASYKGNNIYLKDLHNDYLNNELKSRILNEDDNTDRIIIFEEQVLRPLIEKIHFSSMDMRIHPMYNIYKYTKNNKYQ